METSSNFSDLYDFAHVQIPFLIVLREVVKNIYLVKKGKQDETISQMPTVNLIHILSPETFFFIFVFSF